MSGLFIVLEGGDASGKSTQQRLLAERVRAMGRLVVTTREPGGTKFGEEIRNLLLHGDEMDGRTETLLLAAARAQHIGTVIRPALERNEVVISDRFLPSSLVYQGVGRGLGIDEVLRINDFAAQDVLPDLVFVLDISGQQMQERLGYERDRMERASAEFHEQVRQAYRDLSERFGWILLDGSQPVDLIADQIWGQLSPRL